MNKKYHTLAECLAIYLEGETDRALNELQDLVQTKDDPNSVTAKVITLGVVEAAWKIAKAASGALEDYEDE